MGVLEQNCPANVRAANMWLDTLSARRPYLTTATHAVDVPPIGDDSDVMQSFLMNDHTSLTQTHGGTFSDGKSRPGWGTTSEVDLFEELAERAEEMAKLAADGQLHGDSTARVEALTNAAAHKLGQVESIYAMWEGARIKAKKSSSSFSFYKQMDGVGPMRLTESRNWIVSFADLDSVNDHAAEYFTAFAALLQGQKGGWQLGEPEGQNFWKALTESRDISRNNIRQLLRAAMRELWCAEYAVAESESYQQNKEAAPTLLLQATKIGDEPKPLPGFTVSQFSPPTGDPLPPVSEHEPTELVPDLPTGLQAPAWYTTTPGKVALGLAGVALVSAAGYGVYRLGSRRVAPRTF